MAHKYSWINYICSMISANSFFNLIEKSSVLLFFVAISFLWITEYEIHLFCQISHSQITRDLYIFIGISCSLGYNYLRFKKFFNLSNNKLNNLIKKSNYIFILYLLYLYVSKLMFNNNFQEEICIGICMILVFFYKFNLRNIPYLKIFIVLTCWVLITQIILIELSFFDIKISLLVIRRILLLLTLLLLTEIKDISLDPKNLKNISQQIGITNTLILCYVLISFQALISIYFNDWKTICFLGILFVFTKFLKINSPRYYFTIYLEVFPILHFFICYQNFILK